MSAMFIVCVISSEAGWQGGTDLDNRFSCSDDWLCHLCGNIQALPDIRSSCVCRFLHHRGSLVICLQQATSQALHGAAVTRPPLCVYKLFSVIIWLVTEERMYLLCIAKPNAHIIKPSLSCSASGLRMPGAKSLHLCPVTTHRHFAQVCAPSRNIRLMTRIAKPQRLLREHADLRCVFSRH